MVSVEVLAATRGSLLPNPEHDAVRAFCWSSMDTFGVNSETEDTMKREGVIAVHPDVAFFDSMDFATVGGDEDNNAQESADAKKDTSTGKIHESEGGEVDARSYSGESADSSTSNCSFAAHRLQRERLARIQSFKRWLTCALTSQGKTCAVEVVLVGSEEDLFLAIEDLFVALDPDIVVGWDLERASLGYVLDRAPFVRRNDEHSHHETGNVRKRSAGNNKTPHRSALKEATKPARTARQP